MQDYPVVFLSYARKNSTQIDMIEDILLEVGYQPWVDRKKLTGGQDWSQEIQTALDSSDFYLLLLTPEALQSRVVRYEYLHALTQKKPILIIMFKNVDVRVIPPELRNLPFTPFDASRDRLLYALVDIIDRLSLPLPRSEYEFPCYTIFARHFTHRKPEGWSAFEVPRSQYTAMLLLYVTTLPILLIGLLDLFRYLSSSIIFFLIVALIVFLPYYFPLDLYRAWKLRFGRDYPGVTIVTPVGFMQRKVVFFSSRHFTISKYPFAEIKMLKRNRDYDTLAITPRSDGLTPYFVRFLEGDIRDIRVVIIRQILEQFEQYLLHMHLNSLPESTVRNHIPTSTPVHQTSDVPSTIFIYASQQDSQFTNRIQEILTKRQQNAAISWQIMGNQSMLLNTINNSSVVLLMISKHTLGSNDLYQYYQLANRLGKPVIPLVIEPLKELPPWMGPLQWIDFSNNALWEYHKADFIIALSKMGIGLPSSPFDGELAIAQSVRQQLPSGAKAYPVPFWFYQQQGNTLVFLTILFMLMLSFVIGANIIWDAAFVRSREHLDSIPSLLAFNFFTLFFVVAVINRFFRLRLTIRRIVQQKTLPEVAVISPQGIAFHTIRRRFLSPAIFQTINYPFEHIRKIQPIPQIIFIGPISELRITDAHTGKVHKVSINSLSQSLTVDCLKAFQEYQNQGQHI